MNLEDLVIRAERLALETAEVTELPLVERTLKQVLEATQELHSRVTESGTKDREAYVLLGSKGVDLTKLNKKLDELSLLKSFEPLPTVADSDIKGFLKNERENAIMNVIQETKPDVYGTVERRKWNCVYTEWELEKESLLNAMVGPSQEDFSETQSHGVAPTPLSRLNELETLYASGICSYTKPLNQGKNQTNLMALLDDLKFDDPQVSDMWRVLRYMSNVEPLFRKTDPQRCRLTKPEFIERARSYLERLYKDHMIAFTEKNVAIAKRGGIPNVYNLVLSYVNVNFQVHQSLVGLQNVMNGRPLWPTVFFSLRCGDLSAAAKFLKEWGTCPDLLKLLTPQRIGDPEAVIVKLKRQLRLEYKDKLRDCSDPYKKAVYATLLACDPHEAHAELLPSPVDFLWLQLSILQRQEKGDSNPDQLTFGGLQSLILEKYSENQKTPQYFQVLVLTGQFEAAIEILARTVANRPHAVHMALALNELGLLETPKCVQQPLLSSDPDDPAPMKRLNLVRLVIMYAKVFEKSDTFTALQYYYLLRHFQTKDGHNAMVVCYCDLIVENYNTKTLELIFGKAVKANSHQYRGGLLDMVSSMDCDKYSLATLAGDELSKRSNYESAIKLYFIAGQLERAMSLVSTLLSQVLHQHSRPGSLRERLDVIIRSVDLVFTDRNPTVKAHVMLTYKMLSQLMRFFDYFHTGRMDMASEILENNRIIPSYSTEVDKCMSHLKGMGPEIMKVLPSVLLAAMEIVYAEYVDLKAADGDQAVFLRRLRGRAKALIYMGGCYPNLAVDMSQRLVQLESRMM